MCFMVAPERLERVQDNIWYTCTHLNDKLQKEEHSHTRSCILVLYFWEISANEHQKWKHKKWNNVSGLHMKKMKHLFYIYLLLQMYFLDAQCRCMIVRQSPTIAPSSFTELLTSNRKENHKNIQCTFIFPHILINLLNSRWLFRDCSYSKRTSLCDKKKKTYFKTWHFSPITSRDTQVVPMRLHATGSSEESQTLLHNTAQDRLSFTT